MKVALVGFSNSGKTTVFNAITHQKIDTSHVITSSEITHRGTVFFDDPRLRKISEIVKPKKTTFAYVEFIDMPGLLKDNSFHNAKVFREILDSDALIYILRGFDDPSVPYQFEFIDPLRDFSELEYEFIMTDLELVTKRIERMTEGKKKGQKINEKELEVLKLFSKYLEEGKPLRDLAMSEEQSAEIRHLSFITFKPVLGVINLDEKSFNNGKFKDLQFIRICGIVENEIGQLTENEIENFLEAMGIDEPVNKKITKKVYDILNYISFFTYSPKEVKAWSIKKGTKAIEAAGKVHSDIQRGFIRAEVISYNNFISVDGDINLAKQKGILRVEGKEYEVKDGDVITFRFKI